MWFLVLIIWLFIDSYNSKTKNVPYERHLALDKAELEENIKNKKK